MLASRHAARYANVLRILFVVSMPRSLMLHCKLVVYMRIVGSISAKKKSRKHLFMGHLICGGSEDANSLCHGSVKQTEKMQNAAIATVNKRTR